jgi:hypothetical protein
VAFKPAPSGSGTAAGAEIFQDGAAMWFNKLIQFTFNICGSVLLLFMLFSIGLLLIMLAVLTRFQ